MNCSSVSDVRTVDLRGEGASFEADENIALLLLGERAELRGEIVRSEPMPSGRSVALREDDLRGEGCEYKEPFV